MLEWDHLRIVLAVHRGGSMTAAADVLGVDRATVLRRLDALEGQLKARLFDRRPDGCTLTSSGQNIIGLVQNVERVITELQHRAGGDDARPEGVVKLAAPSFLLDAVIAPAFPLLRALHPGLNLDLREDHDRLDLVRGEAEIAVRFRRPANEAIVARKIGSAAVALYAGEGYIERRGLPSGDFAGHDILSLEGPLGQLPAMGWLWAVMGRANAPLRSDEVGPLVAAVQAGAGIACLPVVAACGTAGIRPVPPGIVGRFDIFLATHRDLRDRARVRAVFNFVTRLFAQRAAILNGAAFERFLAADLDVSADASAR